MRAPVIVSMPLLIVNFPIVVSRQQGRKGQYRSAKLTGDLCLCSPQKLKFSGAPLDVGCCKDATEMHNEGCRNTIPTQGTKYFLL